MLQRFEGSVGCSGWWRGGDVKACMRVSSGEGGAMEYAEKKRHAF
jgi:hypothetical protein